RRRESRSGFRRRAGPTLRPPMGEARRRALHRLDARGAGARRSGLDVLRVADPDWADHAALCCGADRAHRASCRVRRRDLSRGYRIGAAGTAPRLARARHVPDADPAARRAAAGAGAHAACVRLAPVRYHQGHGNRFGDRRTGAHAAVGNAGGAELSADRGLQLRDARVFPDSLSRHARRRSHLSARRASRPLRNFEWSVVVAHRDALAAATGTTVLLTVATMAMAVPCGIIVASLRLYAWAPLGAIATAYVELFRN